MTDSRALRRGWEAGMFFDNLFEAEVLLEAGGSTPTTTGRHCTKGRPAPIEHIEAEFSQ